MICCYNAARNNPYERIASSPIHAAAKRSDSSIREAGLKRFADSPPDVRWLEDKEEESARSLAK